MSRAQIGVINIQNLVLPGARLILTERNGGESLFGVLRRRGGSLFPDLLIDETFCEELIVRSVDFNNNIRTVSFHGFRTVVSVMVE